MRVTKTGSRGAREIKERLKSAKEEEKKPHERFEKRILHPAPIENLEEWNALLIVVGMFVRWMADAAKLKEDNTEFRLGMVGLNQKMNLIGENSVLIYEMTGLVKASLNEVESRLAKIEKVWS